MFFKLNQLENAAQGSPSPHNQRLYLQGKGINQAIEAFEAFLISELYQTKHPPAGINKKWPEPLGNVLVGPSDSAFSLQRKSFADRLHLCTQNHRSQQATLAPFFANERQAAVANIITGNRSDQKALLLLLSDINYLVAANQTLAFLVNQTYDNYRLPLGSLFPVLSFEGDCHRKGETIRGVVSAQLYYRNSSNLTCFIQNKKLGIENGLGKFQSVSHEAGMHNLSVRIKVQTPLTQEIREYFRNTTIKVCE